MEFLAMEKQQHCNTDLCLGWYSSDENKLGKRKMNSPAVKFDRLFSPEENEDESSSAKEKVCSESSSVENKDAMFMQVYKSGAEGSSSSNFNTQRKLRLTREQAALLEDSFREHRTISSTRKRDLAKRLNLLPRQVEVWFQNKRARTKVKQTEVEYDVLKRCCESLREENQKLKRELQELKSMKIIQPFYESCECSITKPPNIADVKLKFDCKNVIDSFPLPCR